MPPPRQGAATFASVPVRCTNAVALTDSVPSYGPPGRSLISVSTLDPYLPSTAMRRLLGEWFGPGVSDWEELWRYDIEAALPVADPPLGRLRRPVRLEPGLYVCGDHRDSPSQQGALVSGRRTAEAVLVRSSRQRRPRKQFLRRHREYPGHQRRLPARAP